ncbi:MAG: hypothetical protein HOK52_07070 [Candidatus Marinimicrobia bacterium]|jgi:hypothetical protein|nr:hypothetical protein [Candidatus Neomarinimicrobiota bacterium]|tara:strand:+ start:68 stop:733 length:666 start_codon:yes stop_codon:yes gene_type:complete
MINRIIPLLLFIGFVWGQADLDKLVLKDGTTYFGEYSKIEGKIVFFKPQDAFGFQPVSVKQVERLELKDGQIIVLGGKVKSITLEEYQKLSTKEKALFDAKLIDLGYWVFYGPLSGITVAGFLFGGVQGEAWVERATIPASLAIPYLILNLKKVEFSYPQSLANEYDRLYYKKVYYKNINNRKTNIIMASIAITGVGAYLIFMKAMSELDFGTRSEYSLPF